MKKLIYLAIKRMVFLGLRPVMLVYAVITGNMRLAQKIEWKRRHWYVNAWKTIIVNFSSFKPSIACKLPIIVYEKLDFVNTGKIVIESNHISRGMLTIIRLHGEANLLQGLRIMV